MAVLSGYKQVDEGFPCDFDAQNVEEFTTAAQHLGCIAPESGLLEDVQVEVSCTEAVIGKEVEITVKERNCDGVRCGIDTDKAKLSVEVESRDKEVSVCKLSTQSTTVLDASKKMIKGHVSVAKYQLRTVGEHLISVGTVRRRKQIKINSVRAVDRMKIKISAGHCTDDVVVTDDGYKARKREGAKNGHSIVLSDEGLSRGIHSCKLVFDGLDKHPKSKVYLGVSSSNSVVSRDPQLDNSIVCCASQPGCWSLHLKTIPKAFQTRWKDGEVIAVKVNCDNHSLRMKNESTGEEAVVENIFKGKIPVRLLIGFYIAEHSVALV